MAEKKESSLHLHAVSNSVSQTGRRLLHDDWAIIVVIPLLAPLVGRHPGALSSADQRSDVDSGRAAIRVLNVAHLDGSSLAAVEHVHEGRLPGQSSDRSSSRSLGLEAELVGNGLAGRVDEARQVLLGRALGRVESHGAQLLDGRLHKVEDALGLAGLLVSRLQLRQLVLGKRHQGLQGRVSEDGTLEQDLGGLLAGAQGRGGGGLGTARKPPSQAVESG